MRGLRKVLCPSEKIFILIFGKWAIFCSKIFLCSGKRGASPSAPEYATEAYIASFLKFRICMAQKSVPLFYCLYTCKS